MGHTEDPKDGKAVAGTLFGAVIVYAVSFGESGSTVGRKLTRIRDFWYSAALKLYYTCEKARKERYHYRKKDDELNRLNTWERGIESHSDRRIGVWLESWNSMGLMTPLLCHLQYYANADAMYNSSTRFLKVGLSWSQAFTHLRQMNLHRALEASSTYTVHQASSLVEHNSSGLQLHL
jgi:hypothetical protein